MNLGNLKAWQKRKFDDLTPDGKEIWRNVFAEYDLNDALFMLSIQFCELEEVKKMASEAIKKEGLLVQTAQGGLRRNPAVPMRNESNAEQRRILKHIDAKAKKADTTPKDIGMDDLK